MNFAVLQTGGFADEDLVQDGWTDIAQRIRDRVVDEIGQTGAPFGPEEFRRAYEESDDEKMTEIRARVDTIVEDRDTAEGMVPPTLQAAVFSRRVPPGLQRARRPSGRYRRPRGRGHGRDRRLGRRGALRARLPNLRLRFRGRH